jgi:hypothetical protein
MLLFSYLSIIRPDSKSVLGINSIAEFAVTPITMKKKFYKLETFIPL